MVAAVEIDHLLQDTVSFRVDTEVVCKDNGKGVLVADKDFTFIDRIAQPLHLILAGIGEGAFVDDIADIVQKCLFR